MIIALTGYSRTGKTLFSDVAHSMLNDVQLLAFADILKEAHSATLGYTSLVEYNKDLHNNIPVGKTDMRTSILELGKKLKSYDPNIFIKSVFDKVDPDAKLVIITDLRFENEYNAIKGKYPIIRIDAPNVATRPVLESDAFIPNIEPDHTVYNPLGNGFKKDTCEEYISNILELLKTLGYY